MISILDLDIGQIYYMVRINNDCDFSSIPSFFAETDHFKRGHNIKFRKRYYLLEFGHRGHVLSDIGSYNRSASYEILGGIP